MSVPSIQRAEIEAAILAAPLSAESPREAGTAMLAALEPILEHAPAALAIRDRDGLSLQVLAESGAPCTWPAKLAPQLAIAAQPAVDAATSILVVPLRVHGRVIGALLLGDAAHATALLAERDVSAIVDTLGHAVHAVVARTAGALQRQAEALRSAEAVVEGMAHQISNPLTGASAILQLLADELADDGQRAAVQQIRLELARAFSVLSDLADFQRDTRAHDGTLDLSAFVERILRFRGYAIRDRGIALDVQLAKTYIPVRADARALEHALLIVLRFAELRSRGTVNRSIVVRLVEVSAAEAAVEIADSGTGETPELRSEYLDQPLLRPEHVDPETLTERPDLGLAESLLRGCGGYLSIRGSKTDGTTLALVLPRAPAVATGAPAPAATTNTATRMPA